MKIGLRCIIITACLLLTSYTIAEEQSKIGVILPLTGSGASFGQELQKGISAANTQGVKLIFDDDACHPKKAVQAYQRLTSIEKVRLFLGPCCTSSIKSIAPSVKKDTNFVMNICTGSESVFSQSGGLIFHPQPSAEVEAKFNAQSLWDLGIRKPIILIEDSEFALTHEKYFKENFPGKATTLNYLKASSELLRTTLIKMKSLEYDAIYVPLVETLSLGLIKELSKLGMKNRRVFSIHSAELPSLVQAEGTSVNNLIYSYPVIKSKESALFYFAKSATEMLVTAAKTCKNDPFCVKNFLMTNYDFDKNGILKVPLELKTIKNGKFVKFMKSTEKN